jgi:hypothetical protein
MNPLTLDWVKAYADKRGYGLSVGPAHTVPYRLADLRRDGHTPQRIIRCYDNETKLFAITYLPAVAVPVAG